MYRPLMKLLPSGLRSTVRGLLSRHAYRVVGDAAGEGFVMIGDDRPQHHFERIYLNREDSSSAAFPLIGSRFERALALARRHGLVVFSGVAPPAELGEYLLRVPRFIRLYVDLRDTEESLYRSLHVSARYDVRKSRNFQMEVHQDVGWAEEFFHRYYEKSMRARHGAEGFVRPVEELVRLIEQRGAEFICVRQDGQRLAAVLAEPGKDSYDMGGPGWLDGSKDLLRRRVPAALYWFTLVRARQLGYRMVNLGGTPPYLDDGVFQFKARWAAHFDHQPEHFGEYHLLIDPAHPVAKRFLDDHTLLLLGENNRLMACSRTTDPVEGLPEKLRAGISRWVPSPDQSLPAR